MHLVVFGVGAIGGFYGTKLARYINEKKPNNLRISFLARGETFTALSNHGTKLICKKENFGAMEETVIIEQKLTVRDSYFNLDINPDELTVVLLCTKSKDTIPASLAIKKKFNDNTLVISIQNGVDNEEKIASILGTRAVIACLTNVAAESLEPGIYLQKGNYGLLIGELEGNLGAELDGVLRIELLKQVFSDAGINVKTTKTIREDQWSKLVWNAAFNPLSVLYQETVGQILADKNKKERLIKIMQETVAVARAQGIKLSGDLIEKHIERTSAPDWYDFRTSMLQDFQKSNPIELDALLGVVIEQGKNLGVETPEAVCLYEELKTMLGLI